MGGGRWPTTDFYNASAQHRSSVVVECAYGQDTSVPNNTTYCAISTRRAKKQRVTPKTLPDLYSQWNPYHGSSSREEEIDMGADTDFNDFNDFNAEDSSIEKTTEDNTEDPTEETRTKRKRYVSSDDPNASWRLTAGLFLNEIWRFDGLGDSLASPCCLSCGSCYPFDNDVPTRLFRCMDCSVLLQCGEYCIDTHRLTPLHRVQEWNGTFFETKSLLELGLVYQLGHGGLPCAFSDPLERTMVVLDTNGVHQVKFKYCNCVTTHQSTHVQQAFRAGWYPGTATEPRTCATFRCLETFRLLNVAANTNANDYVDVLERLSNSAFPTMTPDRYVTFKRMERQWGFLFRCKRSQVGLLLSDINDIQPGSLAHKCWGCPWPDINLPPGWETVNPQYAYLYMPVLAMDANFRLKNRLRARERPDPSIAPGSGYFVRPDEYKEHLSKYVSEKDVSTCIAFAALLLKDTKLSTGMRTSGVAGCACARHEIVRPSGMGDLQKGERYANVDYVFFSAIKDLRLPRIAVSYDIACQWQVNLADRMLRLPPAIQPKKDSISFTFGLPTWHAIVHELKCKAANSLTYQDGVGRTDGEGIERIWSLLNPASYSTKEMTEGSRHDHLDDWLDHHNFKKNMSLDMTLARRLKAAIVERDRQVTNFLDVDKGLDPAVRKEWKSRVQAWKADRSLSSPFLLPDASCAPTETQVWEELAAVDAKEAEDGRTPVYGTSPLAFVAMGLQLEDIQTKLVRKGAAQRRTALQEATFREHRSTFEDMLARYRPLQQIYMPGSIRAIEKEEKNRNPDAEPLPIERTKIWLPSDLKPSERATGCVTAVLDIETQLRCARCADSLSSLRQHLRSKQYLIAFRNANVTGQNESTKARGLIEHVGEKVDREAGKYRWSQRALVTLCGASIAETYPELLAADVAMDNTVDPDLVAIMKLGVTGSEGRRRIHVPTGKARMSWIWTAEGGPENGTDGHEFVRVLWSKASERRNRWTEEVEMLREEMRRVLRSLDWLKGWWMDNAPVIASDALHLPQTVVDAGKRAYAMKQVARLEFTAKKFTQVWRTK